MRNKISNIIVIILIFFGVFVISTTSHELKHYYDLKDDAEIKEICALRIPLSLDDWKYKNGFSIASVKYYPNENTHTSEIGASIISLLLGLGLFVIAFDYIFRLERDRYLLEVLIENDICKI